MHTHVKTITHIAFTLLLTASSITTALAQTMSFADIDKADAIQRSQQFKQYVDSLSAQDNTQINPGLLSNVLDMPTPTQNPNAEPKGMMVFVSLTMPNIALKQLLVQSKRLQIPLVIRGVLPQGFKGTLVRINKLLSQANGKKLDSGFAINPEWFTTFNIQSVPAFVTVKAGKCLPKSPCMDNDFDILYGNISMYDALDILKAGDVGEIPNAILSAYEASL